MVLDVTKLLGICFASTQCDTPLDMQDDQKDTDYNKMTKAKLITRLQQHGIRVQPSVLKQALVMRLKEAESKAGAVQPTTDDVQPAKRLRREKA